MRSVCCSLSGRVGKEGSSNSALDSSPEIDILVSFKIIKTRQKILLTASIATIYPIRKALRYNRPSVRHIGPPQWVIDPLFPYRWFTVTTKVTPNYRQRWQNVFKRASNSLHGAAVIGFGYKSEFHFIQQTRSKKIQNQIQEMKEAGQKVNKKARLGYTQLDFVRDLEE